MLGGSIEIYRNGTIPSLIQALGGYAPGKTTFSLIELLQGLPEMDDSLREIIGVGTSALVVFDRSSGGFNVGQVHVQLPAGVSLEDASQLPIGPALDNKGAQISTFAPHSIIWRSEHPPDDEMASLFMHTPNGYYAWDRP